MAKFIAAFAAIYLIWGSTYLAIKLAIATIPPFLMLSFRFIPAGLLLYAFLRLRGIPAPTRREWLAAAGVGTLMLAGGVGAVAWAERSIHSGLAALLVAAVPMWMVLLDWLGPAGRRPTRRVLAGLAIGFLGVGLIVGPAWEGAGVAGLGAVAVVMFGTVCWAVGSVYSRYLSLPKSAFMASALQMIAAGVALFLLAVVFGDLTAFDPSAVTRQSALAVGYLLVVGSFVAYAAYVWLLHHATPARVSSYAFVNPLVAMLLGVWLGGESFGPMALVAATLVVTSVALVTLEGRPRERPQDRPQDRPDEPIECGGRQSA